MNAYSTLTISRDLEGIRHTIKKFSIQAYYYHSKGFYFSGIAPSIPVRDFDETIYDDAFSGLLRTGYNRLTAEKILNRINYKSFVNANKEYSEVQRMKRAFENRVEGLSF